MLTNPAADAELAAEAAAAFQVADRKRQLAWRAEQSAAYEKAGRFIQTAELIQEAISSCPDTAETREVLRSVPGTPKQHASLVLCMS